MQYPNKDAFFTALKWYSFKNGLNYHVTKSRSEKFKGKCKCAARGVSQDHPRLDSDMISDIILPMVKGSPRILVSVLIAGICSQHDYTPSYYKAWVAKPKAMDKLHHGWENSYNYLC
ncbi:hypothetical protein PVK06_009011 [Gossypium arboreum]|uniref:Transposase MuDR plant domain-containing protein n=1 Tax=Gossypium arboreum TaxID=29729 RepID=A0ABR0QLC6_GOSAR|nr:hypothetical protein PVK06_009011 [Gossypium arboreum]